MKLFGAIAALIPAVALAAPPKPPTTTATYASVVTVSPGGDPAAAVAGITDASATKPYLVKINPGVYNLTSLTGTVVGKPYVDIEGSGEGVTVLQTTGTMVLVLAANEEVRSLTLKSTGGSVESGPLLQALGAGTVRNVTVDGNQRSGQPVGITTYADARFDRVAVDVSASAGSRAVDYGGAGNPVFERSTLLGGNDSGSGFQIHCCGYVGTITFVDSKISAGYYGIRVGGADPGTGSIRVIRSEFDGAWGIVAHQYAPAYVLDSITDSPTLGPVKCVGVVNSLLDPVACPTQP